MSEATGCSPSSSSSLERPRADRGRVDLVVQEEDVPRARRQVAELEGELAVAARLVDRARLDRVHGQAVDPLLVQHERRVLQLLVGHDREARLVEEPAAHRVRGVDRQRGRRGLGPRRRGALADEAEEGEQQDRARRARRAPASARDASRGPSGRDAAQGRCRRAGRPRPRIRWGEAAVPLAVRPGDERGARGDDRAADGQQDHQRRRRPRTSSSTRRRRCGAAAVS